MRCINIYTPHTPNKKILWKMQRKEWIVIYPFQPNTNKFQSLCIYTGLWQSLAALVEIFAVGENPPLLSIVLSDIVYIVRWWFCPPIVMILSSDYADFVHSSY